MVDAGARSFRMIYQLKLAPSMNLLKKKREEFLISLLNSANENVTGLGASIITHSCVTSVEQSALCDARALKKLISLLEGSISQKNASLESLAAVFKNKPGVILFWIGKDNRVQSFMIKFLQSSGSRLRTAAVWVKVNLTFPCRGAFGQLVQLKNAGMVSQIRNWVNGSCLDVKVTELIPEYHITLLSAFPVREQCGSRMRGQQVPSRDADIMC
ncbi:hypothetical protein SADUNF_Sadunf16G0145900 [Salix dunnii]|uniref:Uncharacterized protein n=1 Tax=Salix dunnii TaxID=1413687 RepID=A0A835MJ44_9ROSI|nr:hypothetical protein SADUNF_Sadunf16G0145900 [Salix dunnii]